MYQWNIAGTEAKWPLRYSWGMRSTIISVVAGLIAEAIVILFFVYNTILGGTQLKNKQNGNFTFQSLIIGARVQSHN